MFYPIMTIYGENDVEVTASKLQNDGTVVISIEKWDPDIKDFVHFKIIMPQKEVINVNYPEQEFQKLSQKILAISDDILEYYGYRKIISMRGNYENKNTSN